jgi:hypothetical protein
MLGFLLMVLGLLTELICGTRRVVEDILTKIKNSESDRPL